MSKKQRTHITFVLDETGSMFDIKNDVIGGFNEYISKLKGDTKGVYFTLISFDSNRFNVRHDNVKLKDVVPLTDETYQPGAMTPLIDTCMKAISQTEEAVAVNKAGRVMVTVYTDGYENASTVYRQADLVAKIKALKDKSWEFSFLGADMDAFGEASNYGIAAASTYNTSKAATGQTFRNLASGHTRSSNRTSTTSEWTDAERKKAEGN